MSIESVMPSNHLILSLWKRIVLPLGIQCSMNHLIWNAWVRHTLVRLYLRCPLQYLYPPCFSCLSATTWPHIFQNLITPVATRESSPVIASSTISPGSHPQPPFLPCFPLSFFLSLSSLPSFLSPSFLSVSLVDKSIFICFCLWKSPFFKNVIYLFYLFLAVLGLCCCTEFSLVVVAAAAAKSLQSCLTLCDPIDGSPPGSPVPGILQAKTLEWVAISFSNAWKWKVKVKSLSRVRLLVTPWTAAHQAPPSMGFSRQEYWSGVPSPSPWQGATR